MDYLKFQNRNIESQMIEISRLQKTFNEKLLEQVNNVRDGNEEIQEVT